MRIALTADPELPVPPFQYGGIERVVDMLARGLVQNGHDVVLFAKPASTCPVYRVNWPGSSSIGALDTLRNAATLARKVATGRFDIVHSFSRLAYLTPILPLSVPKLMSYQREISPRTTAMALRLAGGSLEFSAISRRMIDAEPLPGIWHLVPNGVTLELYEATTVVESDAPLVFLGRIEKIKGPHLAIEIARRTGRKLIIAGNVPEEHRGWFDANVGRHVDGDSIRYIGPVDDAQKNLLLREAAALLMPILWEEPFGIVMAEAMACGTPVLGFKRGAVPEIVEHGVTGFVVETIDDLVQAVGRVGDLSRPACRSTAERLFSGNAVTNGYLEVYTDMIARRKSNKWVSTPAQPGRA